MAKIPRLATKLRLGHFIRIGNSFVTFRGSTDGRVRIEVDLEPGEYFRVGDAHVTIDRQGGAGQRCDMAVNAPADVRVRFKPDSPEDYRSWPHDDVRYPGGGLPRAV